MTKHDKWFLICNPIANGGKMIRQWPELQQALDRAKIDYEYVFTESNNQAIGLTMDKIKEGYRKFAVVGGDGSINEVVNGMCMQKEVSMEELLMGLIPLGTANDWARTHRLPNDIPAALHILEHGVIRRQDLGLAVYEMKGETRRRFFNNVAGMSYDAFVARYLEGLGGSNLSKWKYIYYVLRCLFMFRLPLAKVSFDGQVMDGKMYTINVGICKYNGGGLRLVPQAVPDDGLLALTIAGNLSKFKVIRNMYRFYTGTIGEVKGVMTTQAKEILVEQIGEDKILLELDGEFMGYAPVRFSILPGVLRFMGQGD